MRPLPRQFAIGLLVSVLAVAGLGAAWWTTAPQGGALASRLPADAVIAYATIAESDASHRLLSDLYPSLPPPPAPQQDVEALALVQTSDGTIGWLSLVRQGGRTRVHGSDPALEPLLSDPRPRLADDPTFRSLRADDPAWMYVTAPRETPVAPIVGPFLRLDQPIAVRDTGDGIRVRVPVRPTPRMDNAPLRPLVALPSVRHVLRIPSWDALAILDTVVTDHAATVAETLATTFLSDIAPGLSLRHDVSPLLHGTSLLQLGDGFVFEGTGRNASQTDRILRAIHERFGAARGSAEARTVTVEGYVLTTLTAVDTPTTTERTDGAWTVLETRAGDAVLLSARDGARFVLTDAEVAFGKRAETEDPFVGSTVEWTTGTVELVRPFWSDRKEGERAVRIGISSGPGYVEWAIEGI